MLGGRNKALMCPSLLTRVGKSGCEGALSSRSNALTVRPFSFRYLSLMAHNPCETSQRKFVSPYLHSFEHGIGQATLPLKAARIC